MPKYTMSKDGVPRMNLHATIRVTREKAAELRALAKNGQYDSLAQMLRCCLQEGIEVERRSQENESDPTYSNAGENE